MVGSAHEELEQGLARVMDATSITHLQRLSGGASRETWRFTADGEGFVLQRVRPGTIGGFQVEPKVLSAAQLHQIDVSSVPGLVADDQMKRYQTVLRDLGEPHPVFEAAFRWLHLNQPESTSACLVHGDYRLGNIIVNDQGLGAILDWELAHIGDPMEDLGWMCVRAWRFGGAFPAAGLGSYDELFDAYASVTGVRPDPDVVRWWEILGTLKWGIICISQAATHLMGIARSHELAAIGRRVCENEYDLIELLTEGTQ